MLISVHSLFDIQHTFDGDGVANGARPRCNPLQGWKHFRGHVSQGSAPQPSATLGYFLEPIQGS